MNTDHEELIQLIHACLDGQATDVQASLLNSRLRGDAAARDLYLQLADTHSCLAVDESLWMDSLGSTRLPHFEAHSAPKRWFVWRPLAAVAAAAGIVFGMFCTSMVFGYVGPRVVEKMKAVFSEGFESSVTKTDPGLPREVGQWGGDEAHVVNATTAVKAHGGAKMLRFLSATYPGENSPRSQWGDVYRIVDVRGLAGVGSTVARVSASFTQGVVTGEEKFACRVGAYALDQDLSTLPSPMSHTWLQQNNSATGSRRAALKGTGRWQDVSVELPITRETRFVVLHLAVVQEQPTLKSGVVQFPGHFMDDVKMELLTRP